MYKAVQGFKNRTLNKLITLKPSYSYRDNKKIDEKKQNKRSAFFVFSQMSTFNNLLKMHKL